jgi:protoheme IX farnesyltransferase
VRDEAGGKVAGWSFVATLALVGLSLLPVFLGLDGPWYGAAAGTVGALFLWRAAAFLRRSRRDAGARRLFLFSLAYLPLLLSFLVADRVLTHHP